MCQNRHENVWTFTNTYRHLSPFSPAYNTKQIIKLNVIVVQYLCRSYVEVIYNIVCILYIVVILLFNWFLCQKHKMILMVLLLAY